jgi:hypothetical protein
MHSTSSVSTFIFLFTFGFLGGLVVSSLERLCDVGGVSENDFILAAKLDHINTRELVSQKNQFCA